MKVFESHSPYNAMILLALAMLASTQKPAFAQTATVTCKARDANSSPYAFNSLASIETTSSSVRSLYSSLDFSDQKEVLLNRLLKGYMGNQRVLAPQSVSGNVVIGDTVRQISPPKAQVDTCANSVRRFRQATPSVESASYICSLLEMVGSCMTPNESQPHVPDPTIPKRSLVAFLLNGVPFCMGLLLDANSVATARHCFIDRASGTTLLPLKHAINGTIIFETVDGRRSGSIALAQLKQFELSRPFDINEDSVSVQVPIKELEGAQPLPTVKRVTLSKIDQALWVAGPVSNLDIALKLTGNGGASDTWRDNLRWSSFLGAQCRTEAVSEECIYHACQTFLGFSGSPLITAAHEIDGAAVIEYAGLHSGTPGANPNGFGKCTISRPGFNADNFKMFNVGNHSR